MATNTQLCDYALYDNNNKKGRVPFLDDPDARAIQVTKILGILGVSP
jgi:hypothetical protein